MESFTVFISDYNLDFFAVILTSYLLIFLVDFYFKNKLTKKEKLLATISSKKYSTCLLIDIQEFKYINIHSDFKSGDKILNELEDRLKNLFLTNCKKKFYLTRINGDQFFVLGNEDLEDIFKREKKILKIKPFIVNNFKYYIQCNFAQVEISDKDGEKIILKIEDKLNKMKELGRGKFEEEDDLKQKDVEDYFYYKNMIIEAVNCLNGRSIEVFKQDIYSFEEDCVNKAETLVRINDNGKIISPYFFLELSKEIGYYSFISEIVIKKAFTYAKTTNKLVSINLSKTDIDTISTFNLLKKLIKEYEKSNIVFELTETEEFNKASYVRLIAFINLAHKKGFKISMDDFGTGYSNFNYLSMLDIDIIKLDGSIIKDLEKENNLFIVETIIKFSKLIKAKTVAEYVENEDIFKTVKNLGFNYAQGYYIAKPTPI